VLGEEEVAEVLGVARDLALTEVFVEVEEGVFEAEGGIFGVEGEILGVDGEILGAVNVAFGAEGVLRLGGLAVEGFSGITGELGFVSEILLGFLFGCACFRLVSLLTFALLFFGKSAAFFLSLFFFAFDFGAKSLSSLSASLSSDSSSSSSSLSLSSLLSLSACSGVKLLVSSFSSSDSIMSFLEFRRLVFPKQLSGSTFSLNTSILSSITVV